MLERVILEALGGRQAIEARIREELRRLGAGGYLPAEELERATRDALESLQAGLGQAAALSEGAGERLRPLGEHAARALRELLDVPSRAELEALRAELRAGADRDPEGRPER